MKKFIKQSLVAGLLVLLPIAGTVWLLRFIILSAEQFARSFFPSRLYPENFFGYDIPGMGIALALLLVFLTGMLTRLYLGKKILAFSDKIFDRIPLGRSIYKAIQQFLSTVLGEERRSFRKVVLAEYLAPGTYGLGFLTGEVSPEIEAKSRPGMVNVFIPTTPNPTSGFLMLLPEEKVIPLDISVEEAFKLIVSFGVVGKD